MVLIDVAFRASRKGFRPVAWIPYYSCCFYLLLVSISNTITMSSNSAVTDTIRVYDGERVSAVSWRKLL